MIWNERVHRSRDRGYDSSASHTVQATTRNLQSFFVARGRTTRLASVLWSRCGRIGTTTRRPGPSWITSGSLKEETSSCYMTVIGIHPLAAGRRPPQRFRRSSIAPRSRDWKPGQSDCCSPLDGASTNGSSGHRRSVRRLLNEGTGITHLLA